MHASSFPQFAASFAATIELDRYYPAGSLESARQNVIRCVDRAGGAAVIIGPPGTGKSLLFQLLSRQLRERHRVIELFGGTITTRRGLFQSILRALDLPYRLDESELRLTLADYVQHPSHRSLLLFVDEAQSLSIGLLEELRLLTDLHGNGAGQLCLVLFGGLELEDRLASAKLAALSQRIAARCYLEPLTKKETAAYVKKRMEQAVSTGDLNFTAEALDEVYNATDGIPRLINQVCGHALSLSASLKCHTITEAMIADAWADLQQFPAPRAIPRRESSEPSSVVEFGTLDDSADHAIRSDQAPAPIDTPAASTPLERIDSHLRKIEQTNLPLQQDATLANASGSASAVAGATAFQEEEVLVDRYAELDDRLYRSRVESLEGRSLWPLLEPFAQSGIDDWPRSAGSAQQRFDAADVPVSHPVAAPQTVAHSVSEFHAFDRPTTPAGVAVEVDIDDSPGMPAAEDDLIVVDDDQETVSIRSASFNSTANRQEYGQLFARLRRGLTG